MSHRLAGFTTRPFTLLNETRDVFITGVGPAVVILTEVPNITPEVAKFAQRVAEAGFRIYMPQLFGTPGKPFSHLSAGQTLAHVCISREFRVLAANESSPIIDWLRALAREAHSECGGPGVGVVGMCVTGNFGLAMMLDAPVIAPVLSQPSLPVGPLPSQRAGLHASAIEIEAAHDKINNHGARILAMRFEGDLLCPGERFRRLREEFGDGVETIEIADRHAKKGTGVPAHSVLTTHLIDAEGEPTRAALDRTLNFLKEQLVTI
ncbi:MAG: dienelactone hydrolase family protein [Moraxellaceae bacterium]|nr:dienelactone hydrolase family protein [Moraxellaceae bacterium]MDZ4387659.1 dienelactone hydrolase family protein [Moraxellaceae bacterium]